MRLAAFSVWAVAGMATALAQPAANVSVCELEHTPAVYSGQTVAVRANVVGRSPITIFDYEATGCTRQLLVIQPENKQHGLVLDRDETFMRFQRALSQRTRITAIFTGRFEYPTGRRRGMRLVLQRISELSVVAVPSVDR